MKLYSHPSHVGAKEGTISFYLFYFIIAKKITRDCVTIKADGCQTGHGRITENININSR
jgi:hypothetical protein